MWSTLAIYFVVVFSPISLTAFKCQPHMKCASQTEVSPGGAAQSSSNSSINTAQPLSDPYLKIMSASSIEEVLEMGLLYKGNRLATADDLGVVISKRDQPTVSAGGKIARHNPCSPHTKNVRIKIDKPNPRSRFFPTCVKAKRCDGCCGSNDVMCTPSKIGRRIYQRYQMPKPLDSNINGLRDMYYSQTMMPLGSKSSL
ncbi:placenta growth factor [Plakobranchus ocellatus]|uniref:Placenta growth factor n=1 Tax=Plakobranchus ocellatus TaxID=259542 RepID=A0AAV3Y6I5_9GAST|nr:placenta growth factor [Plakobranchus ocellatus]